MDKGLKRHCSGSCELEHPGRDLPEAFGPYTSCYNRIRLASVRPWLRTNEPVP